MTSPNHTRLEIEHDYRQWQRKLMEKCLREALSQYEQRDARSKRQGAMLSLDAVLEHLHRELEVDRALTEPLRDLWDALYDADIGARHELLEPRKVKHRPPLSGPKLALMRAVAIAIDLRMMAGDSEEVAARQVARKLKSFGIKLGGKPDKDDWEIIAGWRDRLAAARLHGSPEHWNFEGTLYHYEKLGLQDAVQERGRNVNELLTRQFEKLRSLV